MSANPTLEELSNCLDRGSFASHSTAIVKLGQVQNICYFGELVPHRGDSQ